MKLIYYVLAVILFIATVFIIDGYLIREGGHEYPSNDYIYQYSIGEPDSR